MNNKILFDNFLKKYNLDNVFYSITNKYNINIYYSNIERTYWKIYQLANIKEFKLINKNINFLYQWNYFVLINNKKFKRFIRFLKENNKYKLYTKIAQYENLNNFNINSLYIFWNTINDEYLNDENNIIWNYLQSKWNTYISRKKIYDFKHE